jgi:hypothetical protein
MDGWMGRWMGGWEDGWAGVKAVIRIAYSNQKSGFELVSKKIKVESCWLNAKLDLVDVLMWGWVGRWMSFWKGVSKICFKDKIKWLSLLNCFKK